MAVLHSSPQIAPKGGNRAASQTGASISSPSRVAGSGGPAPSTSDRILQAALSSFAGKGFEATSLDSLARSLGITKQTILHHFGSKDLLLEATMQHVGRRHVGSRRRRADRPKRV